MFSFAHVSDCHLGFQKQEKLQEIEQRIFEKTLDTCIEKNVNFIVITGDLFHVNLPEMRVQRYAFRKFKEVYDAGIPIYVAYGSHDYSPIADSVIDLLTDVGYLIKATKVKETSNDKISLDFIQDPSTKAKITGLPGRTAGLEKKYYENLDGESLEAETGFKIFLFHAGIDELKSEGNQEMDSMPISLLPRNFDYYAGGHIHSYLMENYEGYGKIAYPGTLFAGHPSDLENNARGNKKGFILVEFDTKIEKTEFIDVGNVNYELVEYDATGKSINLVKVELAKKIENIDPNGKIVMIKVRGEIASGKTSEVDFGKIREELKQNGAIEVEIQRRQFTSQEYNITPARGENRDEIEKNVLQENIDVVQLKQTELRGKEGTELAKKLLRELRQHQPINEKKTDYQQRIETTALKLLGLNNENDS